MARKALTAAEMYRIATALKGDSGLILGMDIDGLGELVRARIDVDVRKSGALSDTDDVVQNTVRLLGRVPASSMPKLLTELIDLAEVHAKQGMLEVDDGFMDDFKSIRDRLVESDSASRADATKNERQPGARVDDDGFPDEPEFRLHIRSFHDLIHEGHECYVIPQYQRRYCWSYEQFDQLWEDLVELRRSRKKHFMGFMITHLRKRDGLPEILDGQQRFATLSILAVAGAKRLKQFAAEGIETEANMERQVTLQKLVTPAEHLDEYPGLYTFLRLGNLDNVQFSLMVEDNTKTQENELLHEAWNYFLQKFTGFADGEEVVNFVLDAFKGAYVVMIDIDGEDAAYSLFETLNDRGVRLSEVDIVKNQLMRMLSGDYRYAVQNAADSWDRHVSSLGDNVDINRYMDALLASREGIANIKGVLKKMKAALRSTAACMDFLRDMGDGCALFRGLSHDNDKFWKTGSALRKNVGEHVRTLDLLGATNHLTMAFVAYGKLSERDFAELMRMLVIMAVRYKVVRKRVNGSLEELYVNITNLLSRDAIDIGEITRLFVKACPPDPVFVHQFQHFSLPSSGSTSEAMYFLEALEKQANDGQAPPTDLTLEHVLPVNPSKEWLREFNTNLWPHYVGRLGNLALLDGKTNRGLGNSGKDIKFEVLRNSPYAINRRIAKFSEWNANSVGRHQQHLANLAKGIWRLPHVK